ncbi:conserved oligomeric Golgi complex subunit 8-like isoform X2 [Liolophura sinensis]|uniref:conserved oligomeric Golgi complex subunit 8-like isoform X2 n=1 Tax=Liolophura sinensis TaxID=3198878 RepID=UPI003158FADC
MATLDVEDESILANIFKDSFPESWTDNSDFLQYLTELSSFGVEKLSKEPDRLAEEKAQILEETQELAFHNYKTFIQTAECSREIFEDFQIIEKHVGGMLDKLPMFAEACNNFLNAAQDISVSRRMNSLTLQRHTQLLEILEVPQLMDTCVRNGYYDEALELAQHVRRWEKKYANIPVIVSIVEEVKNSTQLMLNQLIQQLRTNIQLPACLRVIGYLRRMDVFTEPELRIKFLQARDAWFQGILDAIPKDDAYTHITKTVELSRVHLFDVITQYRAIFSDEDPLLTPTSDAPNEAALFHGWVIQKVSQFLQTLTSDLEQGVGGRLDSILGQCMYFGLSFSRVGADFRGLLAPIFQKAALQSFQQALVEANVRFEEAMQSFSLVSATSTISGISYSSSTQGGQLYPPTVLLDFQPLAAYCNHILTAFNELRLCAPISLAIDVAMALQSSLLQVNKVILAFHRAEESAFDKVEREQFERFCEVYAKQLLPYLIKALHTLFPQSQLCQILGISQADLAKMNNMGSIDKNSVLGPIEHLVPANPEPVEMSDNLSAFALSGTQETPHPEDKPAEVQVGVSPALSGQSEESVQRDVTTASFPSNQEGSSKGDHSEEHLQRTAPASVTASLSESVNPQAVAVSMDSEPQTPEVKPSAVPMLTVDIPAGEKKQD